jgi:hypothetical protein
MPAQNQKTEPSTLKSETAINQPVQVVKPEPLRTLVEWKAPVRPFKKRDREYLTTIGAIVFLLGVILLFLQEWLLIAVIVALVFVAYILSTVSPEETEHKITNRGVITGGKTYRWEELVRFWFTEKWGQKILSLETVVRFPGRLTLLLGEANQEQIKKILSDYLPFEEPEKTWADNASNWLSRQIPLGKGD